jgi:uncharacterized repeat protein (TIGR02543 family)
MKRSKVGFLATVGLVAVASLFTVCKAVGSSPGVFSPAVDQTIDVGYGEFRALDPTEKTLLDIVMPVDAEDPDKPAELGEIALSDGEHILGIKIGEFVADNYTVKVYDTGTPEAEAPEWPLSATRLAVTFMPDGGSFSGANPRIVNVGESVTRPAPDPEKANYTFDGWYSEETLGTLYDFASPVNTNISVWAKWADDAVVPNTNDPGSAYTPSISDWIIISNDDLDDDANTNLTITVSGGTFTISGAKTDRNVQGQTLASTGIKLNGVTLKRRVMVSGAATTPLTLVLNGVAIEGGANNAINLSTANVLLQVDGTNTLTQTGGNSANASLAALHVGMGSIIRITSNTAGSLTATAPSYLENGGAAVGGNHNESAGSITIDGDVLLSATATGNNGAGLGGGRYGTGGTIKIGANAVVEARSTGVDAAGSGIGGGRQGAGGTISIGGNAQVTATGGKYAAGIGGENSTPENTVITITGNAKVYAQGGTDGAGIGGADGDSSRTVGAKITIGTGSDYPVVIAKSGATIQADGANTSAIGAGGIANPTLSVVQIEIKSGFVVAKRMHSNVAGQDLGGAYEAGSYVKITGGSVYAANAAISPAPTNGTTAVFPLYVPSAHAGKLISVPGSPVYTGITISPDAEAMFSGSHAFFGDMSSLYPLADLSATFWLPEAAYTGITTSPSSGAYVADIQAVIEPYSDTGPNRLMQ